MRLVLQRVSQASVEVEGEQVGSIGRGLLVLVGVAPGDGEAEVGAAADKLGDLRVFPDEEGKMNRSVIEAGGEVLVVSQFTLLADLARGRRPSFTGAAPPDQARHLIDALVGALAERGIPSRAGRFGAHMRVSLVNDGPVTIVIDVKDGRVL